MAVDLGTSFIKTGVYTLDGVCLASWSEPVQDERPAPGVFIQHGEFLFSAAVSGIKKSAASVAERAKDIAAIAFTGQMAGAMAVDENWGDVTTWSCSLDSRYIPHANRQRELLAQDFFEISGTNAPVMCSKYAWFKDEFPEEHKRIAKYVMLNGYLIGRLSNIPVSEAKIDHSLITWTGMADIHQHQWSDKLCKEVGIDPAMLPEIVGCTTVGGYLCADMAKELGLKSGIPLVVGAGDKVGGCVGANILDNGAMIFEAASYGAFSAMVPDVRLDTESRSYDLIGGVNWNDFYVHKYIQGSGITIDWFINTFIRDGETSLKAAFGEIERLASAVPVGSENMLSIGLLGGSAIPFNSDLRGLFMGHTWNHHKGHFYRSLLECFAYDLALTVTSFENQYPEYASGEIKMIGGGTKSTIWGQIFADVTGHPFAVLDRDDSALWGTAILAAAGTGAISDIRETAGRYTQTKRVFTPNQANYLKYQPYIALYKEACTVMGDLFRRLREV